MKKILLLMVCIFAFANIVAAQDKKEIKKEEKKVIIIKTIDDDGKEMTKVIEDGDIKDGAIWIEELGDSINIDVKIDKDGEGKRIVRKFAIPDAMGKDEIDFLISDMPECKLGKKDKKCSKQDMIKCHGMVPNFENKAKLGVYIEDFNGNVKVTKVIENSAAYSVGIFEGDVITEIDDKKITNTEELIREVGSHKPGDMIEIELKRNGKTKEFNVRLHGSDPMGLGIVKKHSIIRSEDIEKEVEKEMEKIKELKEEKKQD
ncbi:MAG: PDZ domain-containing protein [Deltaproteobacteria bacterium]